MQNYPFPCLKPNYWSNTLQPLNLYRLINTSSCFVKFRISHQRCSVRKSVLRNFTKFTGKHLCQSLFFNKVTGLACNFIQKETLAQVLFCEFCEISKSAFLTEHVRVTASVSCYIILRSSRRHSPSVRKKQLKQDFPLSAQERTKTFSNL